MHCQLLSQYNLSSSFYLKFSDILMYYKRITKYASAFDTIAKLKGCGIALNP